MAIKADPEDRLSAAFVGLEEDGPVFRLPFTGRVGERKGYGQHSEKLADPVGVNEVGRASRSAVVARPRRSPKPSPHLHPLLAEQGVVGQTEF